MLYGDSMVKYNWVQYILRSLGSEKDYFLTSLTHSLKY
jgi:hypothetical protein